MWKVHSPVNKIKLSSLVVDAGLKKSSINNLKLQYNLHVKFLIYNSDSLLEPLREETKMFEFSDSLPKISPNASKKTFRLE